MDASGADSSGQNEVSLSIEETNKLRAALGLKPLESGADASSTSKEKQAEDNYRRYVEEQAKKEKRKLLAEQIKKQKQVADRTKKLEGRGLGEASDDDGDVLAWVRKSREEQTESATASAAASRNRAKDQARRLARKKAKELDEMDRQQSKDYSASDLAGLRVAHALDDVAGEHETILVLKDTTITEDDEAGDELVSVSLAEQERTKKNIENKKKKPGYRAFDDDEDMAMGKRRGILQQYDDEVDQSGFVLGTHGSVKSTAEASVSGAEGVPSKTDISERMRENTVSLAYEKTREVTDYYTKDEVAVFKKPKKTKSRNKNARKPTSSAMFDDEEEKGSGGAMDVDQHESGTFANSNASADVSDINFVDDDELQNALARTRRRMMKTKQTVDASNGDSSMPDAQNGSGVSSVLPSTQELLQKMRERDLLDQTISSADLSADGGLIISETSEFVRALDTMPVVRSKPVVSKSVDDADAVEGKSPQKSKDSWRDAMRYDGQDQTDQDDKDAMQVDAPADANASNDDDVAEKQAEQNVVEEEPLVSKGLAATLALLSKKGAVRKMTEEEKKAEDVFKKRQKWLAEQKILEARRMAQTERDREKKRADASAGARGKGGDMYDDEDERERERAERARIRELEERFRSYVPNVEIKYHDEFGRELTTKEAWKFQTHKFHGINPGKMKTEKIFQRMQEKIKTQQMGSSETPQGISSVLAEQSKRAGKAYVTLGVGNKSAAPLAAVLSAAASSARASAGSRSAAPAQRTDASIAPVAATAPADDPADRGGFGAVTTVSVAKTDASGGGAKVGGRERIAFGLSLGGMKRKAESAAASAAKRPKDE